MAALAYLFPPVSGLIAYFKSTGARGRFHGLQSVLFGLLWPGSLYACSAITPGATQVAFVVGGVIWLLLLVATAFGADPRVPGTGGLLSRLAADAPR
ncbi:MAG: hypothetical protein M3174_04430 [Actinomycetota bacterium]|nr:hypothetical protein [Actinomycetota bacterium]